MCCCWSSVKNVASITVLQLLLVTTGSGVSGMHAYMIEEKLNEHRTRKELV